MEDPKLNIAKQLQALRDSYAVNLPVKLNQIQTLFEKLVEDRKNKPVLDEFHRLVHTLAGSGPTFGFDELGETAREVERILKPRLQHLTPVDDAQIAKIRDLLEVLHQNALVGGEAQKVVEVETAGSTQPDIAKGVFLVEDDERLAQNLSLQMGHFGYQCRILNRVADVHSALVESRPDILLVEVGLSEGPMAGADLVRRLKESEFGDIPCVFISSRTDFNSRLEAVRAGGEGYFIKPIEISQLIDRLDGLTRKMPEDPYRVLVVDDDEDLAMRISLVLRQAGMVVQVVTAPELVLEQLADLDPELILMDLYMPNCSGRELAKIIRQQEAYLSIPIIFLSSEEDVEKQFVAMRMGGDEFLIKPIRDDHLLSTISIRAERSRALNSLVMHDSLTGLLKHTRIKERLDAELSRSQRVNGNLSFAMIDIDHFKSVNDQYGHLSGDRVIKHLARLLKQRLRQSDSIGRWGGEAFAVVLPDCDRASAFKIVDDLRLRFSELKFLSGETSFNVTLSAGIVENHQVLSAEEMSNAADKALYEAKRRGRHQVFLYRGK